MAAPEGREPIDLTNSDDEGELLNPNIARRPNKIPIPLPPSVHRPQEPSAAYDPVYTGAHNGNETLSSSYGRGKRRKLLTSGEGKSATPQKPTQHDQSSVAGKENGSGYIADDGFSIHRTGSSAHRAWVSQENFHQSDPGTKLEVMNQMPTIRTLNAALKTKGTKSPPSGEMSVNGSITLPISRLSTDGTDGLRPLYISRQLSSPSLSIPSNMSSRKDNSMELDMPEPDVDIYEVTHPDLDAFKPRAFPFNKATKTPKPQNTACGQYSDSAMFSSSAAPKTQVNTRSPVLQSGESSSMAIDLTIDEDEDLSAPKSSLAPQGPIAPIRFTEDDRLLFFLREVKMASRQEISEYFSSRKSYNLQNQYTHNLNRRDQRQDLERPNLLKELAADATRYRSAAPIGNDVRPRRGRPSRKMQILKQQPPFVPITSPLLDDPLLDGVSSASVVASHKSRERPPGRPRGRPRRDIQEVDYTWPRRNRSLRAEESLDEDVSKNNSRGTSLPFRSSEPSEEPSVGPETVLPVDQPLEVDFEVEDASIGLSTTDVATSGRDLPYLNYSQRMVIKGNLWNGDWDQFHGRTWQGSTIHVDFSQDEVEIVVKVVYETLHLLPQPRSNNRHKQLKRALKGQPESKLIQLVDLLRRRLPRRKWESINSFLQDAQAGKLHIIPHIERLGAVRPNRKFSSDPTESTSSMVRQRELGTQTRRGWNSTCRPLSYRMKNNVFDTLGPAFSYTGASSDVHTVAWSPDGQCFAAGAVCVTDPDSMQYNRPNNLLYGDVTNKVIHELAEHSVYRPRTKSGPNSTHAMYVSQDPKLFTTVSAVAFSPKGDYMFSTGYDWHACIWRIRTDGEQPELIRALKHKAEVDLLAVSCDGKMATAAKKWTSNAVKVITIDDQEHISKHSYTSMKATERPDFNILPTSLQFEPNEGRMLLAGFGANKRQDRLDMNGDICLWDVETQQQLQVHGSTRNVFDAAFNPSQRIQPLFGVGCVAGINVNRGIRSLIRTYDMRALNKYGLVMELECPSLDMNDIVYCPYDENYIAASCTSGATYVWDLRKPDFYLYRLSHGRSIMPLDDDVDREIADTGVRFLSWGENATRLYTGSSDGTVKVWDIARSPKDVFIKDLITVDSGIMSGAFSPDKSRLIIGEVNGSINVLEVGRDDCSVKDTEKFKYLEYQDMDNAASEMESTQIGSDSGRAIASQLLANGEMQYAPFGGLPIRQAVQGPSYSGPFDSSVDAPFLREQALKFQLSLAKTPGSQCDIPACKDNVVKITSEDIGESGRSGDRIPDELRRQWTMELSDLKIVPGKSKCTNCGRPARVLDSVTDTKQALLCERCAFACFRCGSNICVHTQTETLTCDVCKGVWDIGVLGYECMKDVGRFVVPTMVPRLERFGRELMMKRMHEDEATFGDEMNALTEYYHSLAVAQPALPLL
ncbi:WD40 repeat-like protein [Lojkania enalia]|uniref:WD40 repeat-like protein n=1 Tax=Lojkania enalia TaxID=147567 RepID=A0A9P4N9C9_9PLEO|nr:WD40 repeat-like protein [Didymosphaeria enalia]